MYNMIMTKINWEDAFSSQEEFNKAFPASVFTKESWYESFTDIFQYTIPRTWGDFKYNIKRRYQLATRGYSDEMVWEYADTMLDLNIRILTELKKTKVGTPVNFTEKKWGKLLDTIIDGFKAKRAQSDIQLSPTYVKEYTKLERVWKKGMVVYVEYYGALWD